MPSPPVPLAADSRAGSPLAGSQETSELFRTPAVLHQFLAGVTRHLGTAPQDRFSLWKRAELLRGLGDTEAAAAAYETYATVYPDDPAAPALARLMRGDPDSLTSRQDPVPFLRVDSFLPPADHASLWELVETHAPRLLPSGISDKDGNRVDLSLRQSVLTDADQALSSFLLPRLKAAVARLDLPARFNLPNLVGGRIEMQISCHTEGGFLRLHRDTGDDRGTGRALTYLCYLRRPSTRFTGGDLLLIDETGPGFTRITPTDNTLLFFPADRLHAVTEVFSDASSPLDGRVTVNGWFHRPRQKA